MKRFLLILAGALLVLGCQKEVYHNITVSVNPAEGGSVSPSSGPVLDGTSVSFKATPKSDYVFTGWSGSISGTENPKTVAVTQDMNVTANFTLRSYPLTITIEGDGTVSEKVVSTKSEYQSGTIVELTANPSDHWLFDHWEGDLSGNDSPAQITVSNAKSVKAVFVEKNYPLNIEVEGEGSVSEKVIQTKSTYQEGVVVELTANPSNGWTFDHWERDLEGNENPAQITVSSEKTVKAVFIKRNYSFNVKIIGPGAVDEYLVEQTKSTLEYGQKVRLVAKEDPHTRYARFKGWEGDIQSTDKELEFPISNDISVSALFEYWAPKYPEKNYFLPSVYTKDLFLGRDFSRFTSHPNGCIPVDYNLDGYIDVITFNTKWLFDYRPFVEFYLGQADGSFISDEKNNAKNIVGPNNERKTIIGDYNNDGYPDVALISHGYDNDPYPGDYPIILLSDGKRGFTDVRFEELVGYFHSGASGDFDNDGDIDIFYIDNTYGHSAILENNGQGSFTIREDLMPEDTKGLSTCDIADLNKDGYLDLILGSCNYYILQVGDAPYTKVQDKVIWGNGESFASNSFTLIPSPPKGYAGAQDFAVYDLDGDSHPELISALMIDRMIVPNNDSWGIQILKINGVEISDVSSEYFDNNENWPYDPMATSITWIDMDVLDGKQALAATISMTPNATPLFWYENGKFIKHKSEDKTLSAGFLIYSEEELSKFEFATNISVCSEESYAGSKCIKWNVPKPWTESLDKNFQEINFTNIVNDDYSIEFYVKSSDPNIELCTNFESNYAGLGNVKAFGYQYKNGKNENGWIHFTAKLKDFYLCEGTTLDDWNNISRFKLWVTSESTEGSDVFIDEIRVRKVIENGN